jgi:hypothetical protein
LLLEVEVAAAAPATTTNNAKMRIASFIISNPLGFGFAELLLSLPGNCRENQVISTVISFAWTNNNRHGY